MKVLISAPYIIEDIDGIEPILRRAGLDISIAEVDERLTEAELIQYVGELDGVICGDDMFTAHVLESAAPRLRVISKWGTGIDSIDVEAAERLGILVLNTPNAFTDPVADTVLGLVLSFARGIHRSDRDMKSGSWKKLPIQALNECVLGIVGVGNIGSAVVERAKAFGLKTIGNDIREEVVRAGKTEMVTLEDLLQRSDFVSLNCDLNPSSHHLIDSEALRKMRPEAVLINTARGAVVDEPALIDALQNRTIAGAALDVFEDEPLPEQSPLRSMPNVILSPHNANGGRAVRLAVHRSTLTNLFRGLGMPAQEFELKEGDRD